MWFTVPIYLRSSEPADGDVLLEEAIHLIEAESAESAMEKARSVANELEHCYPNAHGKEVRWSLDEIGEPWELLDDLRNGAEIYSRFINGKTHLGSLPPVDRDDGMRRVNRGRGRNRYRKS